MVRKRPLAGLDTTDVYDAGGYRAHRAKITTPPIKKAGMGRCAVDQSKKLSGRRLVLLPTTRPLNIPYERARDRGDLCKTIPDLMVGVIILKRAG